MWKQLQRPVSGVKDAHTVASHTWSITHLEKEGHPDEAGMGLRASAGGMVRPQRAAWLMPLIQGPELEQTRQPTGWARGCRAVEWEWWGRSFGLMSWC